MKMLKFSVLALLFPCFALIAQETQQEGQQEEQQKEEAQEPEQEVNKGDDTTSNYLNLAEDNVAFFGKKLKKFHELLAGVLGAEVATKVIMEKMEMKGKKLAALLKRLGVEQEKIDAVLAKLREKFEAKMKKLTEGNDEAKADEGETPAAPAPAETK